MCAPCRNNVEMKSKIFYRKSQVPSNQKPNTRSEQNKPGIFSSDRGSYTGLPHLLSLLGTWGSTTIQLNSISTHEWFRKGAIFSDKMFVIIGFSLAICVKGAEKLEMPNFLETIRYIKSRNFRVIKSFLLFYVIFFVVQNTHKKF